MYKITLVFMQQNPLPTIGKGSLYTEMEQFAYQCPEAIHCKHQLHIVSGITPAADILMANTIPYMARNKLLLLTWNENDLLYRHDIYNLLLLH